MTSEAVKRYQQSPKGRATAAAWRAANKDRAAEAVKRHRAKHGNPVNDPEYQRRYRAEHVEERRAARRAEQAAYTAWIQGIKLDAGCLDCGYREDGARLHFDHRPGTDKLFNIAKMHGRVRTLAEIEKCDVRCTHCHAKRHGAERSR